MTYTLSMLACALLAYSAWQALGVLDTKYFSAQERKLALGLIALVSAIILFECFSTTKYITHEAHSASDSHTIGENVRKETSNE